MSKVKSSSRSKRPEYIETETGNRISRVGLNLVNTQSIILGGKTIIQSHCTIRGDLQRTPSAKLAVTIGRYCLLSKGCTLKPPSKQVKGELQYWPLKLGDYVHIGEETTIEAANIGSYVHIGKRCQIGNFCIIKDGVWIEDETVLPPFSVIASLSFVKGQPGLVTEELPESTLDVLEAQARTFYETCKKK
ncbi:dynactin subunit p25 [Protomyces lactucae-debilis]|uniref:Dynactin subunit 5 n=1 Tax=Protomyces lactucae-debilis TaxID=2754530 RepID=A0A1Y2EQ65_PROLT|nr:dynactin subunit p25 [Protomyces lactucae-debilis]ORY73689.1 dynactin subunit p25 [Protomyces lactucae-debilis]